MLNRVRVQVSGTTKEGALEEAEDLKEGFEEEEDIEVDLRMKEGLEGLGIEEYEETMFSFGETEPASEEKKRGEGRMVKKKLVSKRRMRLRKERM